MKKILSTLAILFTLASCNKDAADLVPDPPAQEKYFSQVRRYSDGRTPSTDTVWTLKLQSPDLVATYQALDGYVYETTSTFTRVGVFYSR